MVLDASTEAGPIDHGEAARVRKRTRWVYGGFVVGIVVGFAVSGAGVAFLGYHVLPFQLVWNLLWIPYLGAIIGFNLSRTRKPGPWHWRWPQFRTRTLMVVVAYVALLFGMGVSTQRLGEAARRSYQKYVTSSEMAKIFRNLRRQAEGDAALRKANVAALRAGRIPAGLLQIQRDFLQSLETDPKVTPEFRQYRRGLITDGEEQLATLAEQNIVGFRKLVEYHGQLAAKYDRARWHPWDPVAPDPPPP